MAAPLQISTPCHEDWSRMTPNAAGRHCEQCALTVTDLTTMSAPAARAVLARAATATTHLCVRADTDRRGRILLPGITRRLLTNGLAAVLAMAVAGCEDHAVSAANASAPTTTNTTTSTATERLILPEPPAENAEITPENSAHVDGSTAITMGDIAPDRPTPPVEVPVVVPEEQHIYRSLGYMSAPRPAEDHKPPAEPVAPANTNANG